jgi:ABC-type phosphonate transport system ATPase subunit
MIKMQNLSRTFGDFKAVDDISFEVAAGEIFALPERSAAPVRHRVPRPQSRPGPHRGREHGRTSAHRWMRWYWSAWVPL